MASIRTFESKQTFEDRPQRWLNSISRIGFLTGWTLFDISLVGLTGIMSNWLHSGSIDISGVHALTIVLVVIISLLAFKWVNLHDLNVAARPLTQLRRAVTAVLATMLIVATIGYLTKAGYHISRSWIALWLIWILLFFIATRPLVAAMYNRLEAQGSFVRRYVVFVSSAYIPRLEAMLSRWQGSMQASERVVAIFVDDLNCGVRNGYSWSNLVVGNFASFAPWAATEQVDQAIVAMPAQDHTMLDPVLECVETLAIDADLIAGEVDDVWARCRVTKVAGLPCVRIMTRPLDWSERKLKSLEDMVVASLALVISAPFMAVIAVAIRLESPGPVLFRQPRHGFNNQTFEVLKFRTMHHEQKMQTTVKQAVHDDPRVTRVGKLLRRTSLDELPQIFNVLRGEMSMVGPRPHAVEHNDHFARRIRSYLARHRVLPGITGWAQVKGFRGETDTIEKMQDRVVYDLYYVDNWSLWLDMRILLMTFRCLAHPNAY